VRKKYTDEDELKLLDYLMHHSIKDASVLFKISEGACRQWLYRIRKKIMAGQAYLNRIRTMQRISSRVRKLTTSADYEPEPKEDEVDYF